MANNYCESSSFLRISKEKIGRAQKIIEHVEASLEEDEEEGYCGFSYKVEEEGVWFHTEESISPEHVEMAARALVDELEIDEPFICSWAYTCSKPRIDEFGGGAFALKRGYKTFWCDAQGAAEKAIDGRLRPLDEDDAEPVLCYVNDSWAYFTTQKLSEQWGDDWDDAPYEHNAGPPYTYCDHDKKEGKAPWRIVKVAWDAPFYTPAENCQSVTVESINKGDTPWLTLSCSTLDNYKDQEEDEYIMAGETLREFTRKIVSAGGSIYTDSKLNN